MKVTPRTEEEIKYLNMLPEGEYNFLVIDAIEKVSKSGNEMIHLIIKITKNNKNYQIHDYLMDTEKMSFKLRHCCESLGILSKYELGEVSSKDFIDKKGSAKIIISVDKNGVYDSKNTVKDYLVSNKDGNADFFNDEVPFWLYMYCRFKYTSYVSYIV